MEKRGSGAKSGGVASSNYGMIRYMKNRLMKHNKKV